MPYKKQGRYRGWLYKNFRFKLSIAIPVIITSLVAGAGILIVSLSRGIFAGLVIDPKEAARVANTIRLMAFSYFISVGFTLIIAVVITYAVTKPIERLINKAKEISAGNFAYDLDFIAYDEFSILEKTFNEMAKSLKEYRDQLEEYSRTLENKVAERTRELETMLGLSKELISALDRRELLTLIMDRLGNVIPYRLFGCLLFLEDNLEMNLRVIQPLDKDIIEEFKEKILLKAKDFTDMKLSPENIVFNIDRRPGEEKDLNDKKLESVYIAPLIAGGNMVGLLALGNLTPDAFNEDSHRVVNTVANHLALAVENTKVYSRMKELNQMKSDFITNVSHELRTPLTAIVEGVDLVSDTVFGELNERQLSLLDIIKRNTERLSVLINNLLDLSKLESGKVEFKMNPTNIYTLIEDSVKRFSIQANNKLIRIENQCQSDLPEVLIDQERTAQVLTNLIGNAVKFTPENGQIRISAKIEGKELFVTVANTGTPIPQDKLKRIFDKFYQIRKTSGPGSRGTGLGLSISKEIIERQGGRIWAESSEGINRFIFTLPIFKR